MKKLAIVILNWNGQNWLEQFLPNVIAHSSLEGVDVIVADNGSTDGSIEFLNTNFSQTQILDLGENYGFAEGYNRALIQLKHQYFLLLNSDVEVTKNWLEPLIKLMDSNPKIGACQPKILDYNHRDYFEYAGASGGFIDKWGYPFCRGRIMTAMEKDKGQYNDVQSIFWASGACMLVRSDAFFEAGLLDDDFFAHNEEIDLCWRMQHLDYTIKVVPDSVVYHVGGGTLPKSNPRKTYLNFRNNLCMLYKNLPASVLFYTIIVRMILDGVAGLKFLLSGNPRDFIAVLKAHFSFYKLIPSIKIKRKAILNKKALKDLNGVYSGSMIWAFFIEGVKKYSDLEIN